MLEEGCVESGMSSAYGAVLLQMLAMAKEQHGCRYLQRVIADESPKGLQPLLAEILPEVGVLMMDPFGNYLVQKVLEICSSEQRSAVLNQACETTGLMSIACNMHGTRALQKLVETVCSSLSFSSCLHRLFGQHA
jgi:hypothetical protein